MNAGTFLSPATASVMVSMPNISTAKPKRIPPTSFFLSLLANIYRITPITAKTGEKDDGFKRFSTRLSPCILERLNIHAVTVVPTFAPIIMPMACLSFITPEFTKPTTITVVADDDCITAVTPKPNKKPLSGLDVNFSNIDFN